MNNWIRAAQLTVTIITEVIVITKEVQDGGK